MHQNKLLVKIISILPILILSYSCSKHEGGVIPRDYHLQLNFQNGFGTEILKDIPNEKLGGHLVVEDKDGWSGKVESNIYNLNIISPELCFKLQEPQPKRPEYQLFINKIANHYYLDFRTDGSHLCPPAKEITYKFICPHIFGDNVEHVIISYWKPREDSHSSWILKDGTSAINYCYRLTIDGKEFPVTQEPLIHKEYDPIDGSGGYWDTVSVAWIVLDS